MNISEKKVLTIVFFLLSALGSAQINNPTTENIKVSGNCVMCKAAIEHAGYEKDAALVNWNQDTKMASITYDPQKTNINEIVKRIVLTGYDSNSFQAPSDVYSKLPQCCRYTRDTKTGHTELVAMDHSKMAQEKHSGALQEVYDRYFSLKDALVKSNSKAAGGHARELLQAVSFVSAETFRKETYMRWMKTREDIAALAKKISATEEISRQRLSFKSLSIYLYDLMKTAKDSAFVYYQHCPMEDGQWLSRESTIKNPYFGSAMMDCGKTIDTID